MVEYLANCLTNMAVKEFWKSVYICQSHDKKSSVLFLETQCICTMCSEVTSVQSSSFAHTHSKIIKQ